MKKLVININYFYVDSILIKISPNIVFTKFE